ncbi:MAG: DUF2283 domain-containing protein [Candidatus Aerophobetes bacterium]|nr:DUF2283 domain-containing protein [Candidatus Aerophobetes bacterium]
MKLKYNLEDDVLIITLKDKPLSYGEEVSENIIAHYSDKDELIEIEILDASKFLKVKKEVTVPEKATV